MGQGGGEFSPKCVICPVGGNYSPIGTLIFPIVHLTGRAIKPIERCPTMTTFSLSLSHLSFSGGSMQSLPRTMTLLKRDYLERMSVIDIQWQGKGLG